MEKICLSQDNFDKLLHLALQNCKNPDKKISSKNINYKPISFFGPIPPPLVDHCEKGNYFSRKEQKCLKCPTNENDYNNNPDSHSYCKIDMLYPDKKESDKY